MCGASELELVYLVDGARKYPGQRRWTHARFTICADCYTLGFDPSTGYQHPPGRERERVHWSQVVGRGEQMAPTPCVSCGTLVVRNADPLLKRVTCSPSCATSLTRIRNGGRGSGRPCESCGEPVTTGRADSRYCGSSCRQKSYRRRVKDGHA